MPVTVENISNAAALAEKEYGLGRGRDHMVFINLSVGIGAGIVAGAISMAAAEVLPARSATCKSWRAAPLCVRAAGLL